MVSASRIRSNKAAWECCSSFTLSLIPTLVGTTERMGVDIVGSTPCSPANAPLLSRVWSVEAVLRREIDSTGRIAWTHEGKLAGEIASDVEPGEEGVEESNCSAPGFESQSGNSVKRDSI